MRAALVGLGLLGLAAPAAAQSYGYERYGSGGYYGSGAYGDQGVRRHSSQPATGSDWRSQLDRPGDYRCDAYWDANRTDCGAGWRDQRRYASRDYSYGDSYGYGRGRHGWNRRGYGNAWGHEAGATRFDGAYGRPDLVYPGGGRAYAGYGYGAGRNAGRIEWCRATYRSYDPASGYYRAYSGRLIWCG